jgi:SPP1 gp7 family putative phage head morphogenesis protein
MIEAQFLKSLERLFLDEISLIFYAIGTDLERTDSQFQSLFLRGKRIAESLPNLRPKPENSSIEDLLGWAREGVRALVAREASSVVSKSASRLNRYVRLEVSRILDRSIFGTPFEIDAQIFHWVETNVRLIRSVDFTEKIAEIIDAEFRKGSSVAQIRQALETKANLSKHRARVIAVDQTGHLYSQLTEYRHREQGISKAVWITKRDSRVRPSHREMHGVVFSWDDLPIVGKEKTAPGRPIMCRCVARPTI